MALAGTMAERSIFRFLFRLAGRAPALTQAALARRLVTGVANHYDALTCRIYTSSAQRPAATAEEDEVLELLPDEKRTRLMDIERRLVQRTLDRGGYATALDLDNEEGEVETFLHSVLEMVNVFAFPILADGRSYGAILLYLTNRSRPLAEADQQALMAIGELVRLAGGESTYPSA